MAMAATSSDQGSAVKSSTINALASRFLSRIFSQEEESTLHDARHPTVPPWDSWELDEGFFRALSRWSLENPETTLDRVLDNIRDGLEHSEDLFGLIPESPFPARGLVIALAHLLKLGISVRRAQREVYDFAKDVVRWVALLKATFESTEDGHFARRAWRDLRQMRELVEKFSLWAVERLNDGRWLQIGHGLMISKEIKEFNERIVNARALFQDLSAINMARGLDAILRKMRNIIISQQTIAGEIQEIRKTQQKQLDRIADALELQNQVEERERFFAQTLDLHAITSSAYDSQGKRPCDEGTRVEVLEDIRRWRSNIKRGSPNFLWLTGDPGCGKSAVTASFARECKDEGVLWAQFFINRNNAETADPRSYFPSIARQLANYSPEVAQAIHLTLVKQRSLTDDISADQAARLFTDSIRKASTLDPDRPVVVVIDGLDETDRDRLADTAKIFSTLFTMLEAYSNVKVFISSRTENEIQKSFSLSLNTKHVKHVHLNTANPSSIRDVSLYIKRNLLDLVKEHDLNWDVWPGNERSQALGDRASGLFIWAVTAIKFIHGELESLGEECLDEVLNMLTAEVLHDINALYTLIITVAYRHREDEWEFETFRRIVGSILCLPEPLCIDDLATLLDLRKTLSGKPVAIVHFVRRFRTLLVAGTDAIDGSTIPRIHKSVYEFFTSSSVDKRFRIDPNHAHLELAMQCLAYFATLPAGFKEDVILKPYRYACHFWSSHLSQANIPHATILCADYKQSSVTSLPSLFLRPSSHKSIHVHYSAATSRIEMPLFFGTRIWDATDGLSITHTLKINGVALSADGKDILTSSTDGTIRVWDSTTAEFRRRLVKHSGGLYRIAVAPNVKSVASVSHDGVVCLWDYLTGALIWRLLEGGDIRPSHIAFSHNCEWIVSSWEDNALRLLDARNGEMIGNPWTGHNFFIDSVSFSSNSHNVCSVDAKGHCIIWDVDTGQITDTWKCGLERNWIRHTWSPTDDDIIAFYNHLGVEIRSQSQIIQTIPTTAHALSFSLDGKHIIFGTYNTISITEVGPDEQKTRSIRVADSSGLTIKAFSPTWDFVYLTGEHHTPHVHAIQHDTTLPVQHITTDQPPIPNLYDMEEIEHGIYTATNNQRLNMIRWYKLIHGVNSGVRVCMVVDNMVVVGYDDGSLVVWNI